MYVVGKLQSTVLGEEATAEGLESEVAVQAFTMCSVHKYILHSYISLYLPTHTSCMQKRKNKTCGRNVSPAVVLTINCSGINILLLFYKHILSREMQTEDRRGYKKGEELRREQEREQERKRWLAGLEEVVEELEGGRGAAAETFYIQLFYTIYSPPPNLLLYLSQSLSFACI